MILGRIRELAKNQPPPTEPAEAQEVVLEAPVPMPPRPDGPWDVLEVTGADAALDFGFLQLRPREGVEVRVEVHQESGQISRLIAATSNANVFLQPFATPKSKPMWPDLSKRIIEQAKEAGQSTRTIEGEFGVELAISDGTRWVGIDGPRWLLRCIYTGAAEKPGGAPQLEGFVKDAVVVRGDLPWPPGDGLPLKMPEGLEAVQKVEQE